MKFLSYGYNEKKYPLAGASRDKNVTRLAAPWKVLLQCKKVGSAAVETLTLIPRGECPVPALHFAISPAICRRFKARTLLHEGV
jgi:hypothetical protein